MISASCTNDPEVVPDDCTSYVFDGDVILKTQEEVNQFGRTCYSAVDGLLQIGDYDKNSDISDLSALGNIRRAQKVHLIRNPELTSLKGLQALNQIFDGILLFNNPLIEDLNEFSNIRNSHLSITLYENTSLNSLKGLDGIREYNNVDIVGNPALRDLERLNGAERMNCLYIEGNNILRSLNGLESLNAINCLYIWSNPQLTDYCAITGLFKRESKRIDLQCSQNGYDISLDELSNGYCKK
jgi:hypothetical protein